MFRSSWIASPWRTNPPVLSLVVECPGEDDNEGEDEEIWLRPRPPCGISIQCAAAKCSESIQRLVPRGWMVAAPFGTRPHLLDTSSYPMNR